MHNIGAKNWKLTRKKRKKCLVTFYEHKRRSSGILILTDKRFLNNVRWILQFCHAFWVSDIIVCWQAYIRSILSSIRAEMSDFLRPAGGHIGNLRSGPILAVLIHSLYARRNRLFTKRSKNWAWSQVNAEGEKRVMQFFYDVIAVWAKWGPVSWMAGKAELLWSTVFFWQIYKTYSIGNSERSFPQREAYSF